MLLVWWAALAGGVRTDCQSPALHMDMIYRDGATSSSKEPSPVSEATSSSKEPAVLQYADADTGPFPDAVAAEGVPRAAQERVYRNGTWWTKEKVCRKRKYHDGYETYGLNVYLQRVRESNGLLGGMPWHLGFAPFLDEHYVGWITCASVCNRQGLDIPRTAGHELNQERVIREGGCTRVNGNGPLRCLCVEYGPGKWFGDIAEQVTQRLPRAIRVHVEERRERSREERRERSRRDADKEIVPDFVRMDRDGRLS